MRRSKKNFFSGSQQKNAQSCGSSAVSLLSHLNAGNAGKIMFKHVDRVPPAAKIEHWLNICDKYWPTLELLKKAQAETKASIRRGKGNYAVVQAKLDAITQKINSISKK